jgi:hypothetical protein
VSKEELILYDEYPYNIGYFNIANVDTSRLPTAPTDTRPIAAVIALKHNNTGYVIDCYGRVYTIDSQLEPNPTPIYNPGSSVLYIWHVTYTPYNKYYITRDPGSISGIHKYEFTNDTTVTRTIGTNTPFGVCPGYFQQDFVYFPSYSSKHLLKEHTTTGVRATLATPVQCYTAIEFADKHTLLFPNDATSGPVTIHYSQDDSFQSPDWLQSIPLIFAAWSDRKGYIFAVGGSTATVINMHNSTYSTIPLSATLSFSKRYSVPRLLALTPTTFILSGYGSNSCILSVGANVVTVTRLPGITHNNLNYIINLTNGLYATRFVPGGWATTVAHQTFPYI